MIHTEYPTTMGSLFLVLRLAKSRLRLDISRSYWIHPWFGEIGAPPLPGPNLSLWWRRQGMHACVHVCGCSCQHACMCIHTCKKATKLASKALNLLDIRRIGVSCIFLLISHYWYILSGKNMWNFSQCVEEYALKALKCQEGASPTHWVFNWGNLEVDKIDVHAPTPTETKMSQSIMTKCLNSTYTINLIKKPKIHLTAESWPLFHIK